MRTFAEKRDGSAGTEPAPVHRGPTPLARMQRSVGNLAMQERFAEHAESQARATPAPDGLLAGESLSEAGRRYFGPIVGGDVGSAQVHVGGRADAIAGLAHAEAVSYGDDVFIPGERFASDSNSGRGLLAHELSHVARERSGPPRLSRKPKETTPHYPTPDEKEEIDKLLGRAYKGVKPTPAATPVEPGKETPVETRGRILTEAEVTEFATKLEPTFFAAIDAMDEPEPPAGTPKPPPPVSEKEAFIEIERARQDVLAYFTGYASHGITTTRDATTTVEGRKKANQLLVEYGAVKDPEGPFAFVILNSPEFCGKCFSELAALSDASREAVAQKLVAAAVTKHWEMLSKVAKKRVGGMHGGQEAKVWIKAKPDRNEVYGSAVHEFVHNLAHPVFTAAFSNERNVIEGFTEYFTRQIVSGRSSYPGEYEQVHGVYKAMTGPFAMNIGGGSVEESMRLAYFKGQLDLIGWYPIEEGEEEAVKKAGGSAKWDPVKGRKAAKEYKDLALAIQSPHLNYLGTGIYFSRQGDATLAVSYARVLWSSEYSRAQVSLQGQLLGTPEAKPTLGGSLGAAVEYQDPWFYVGGGLRFVGTGDLSKDKDRGRIDIAPFAGAGVRLWQRVRIGPEAMVLLPVLGSGINLGIGGTVAIELGAKAKSR